MPNQRSVELPNRILAWPPLLVNQLLTQTRTWDEVQQRRLQGREALRRADTEGIDALAARLQARQARVIEIRRAQFEAEERLRVSGEAQIDRENQAKSVLERMEEIRDDLSLAKAQYEISRVLASPENDTFLIQEDPIKVAAEIQRLKSTNLRAEIQIDVKTGVKRARVLWPGGVSPRSVRVLYAASRDALKVLCDSLEREVSQAETDAASVRKQRAIERENDIKNQVAQRLEGIKGQSESLNLRLDQEDNLAKIFLAEELPTRRASVSAPTQEIKKTNTVSPLPQRLRPVAAQSLPNFRANELEELRAAVLDEAQKRGIRVRFSPASGVPDRTAEFANWIKVKLP